LHNVELMGATPTIYARSRDRWRAYTSNTIHTVNTMVGQVPEVDRVGR
jgi:hypothetical protein